MNPIRKIFGLVGLTAEPPNEENSQSIDWLFTLARTRRLLGVSILIGMNVAEDVRNSSTNKIVVSKQKIYIQATIYM